MSIPTTTVPAEVAEWFAALEPLALEQALGEPARAAVFSADMVVGFCKHGNLASPRIDALSAPVATLFRRCHDLGVRDFVLAQDTHHPQALEFNAFPPHCIRDTDESDAISELASLPFADTFVTIRKDSLDPAIGTDLEAWLDGRPDLRTTIVVGDCTDLCVYRMASYLRLRANVRRIEGFSVIVVADLVDTYDLPREAAKAAGAFAHDGDFWHQVFLYHMAMNGIHVVRTLT